MKRAMRAIVNVLKSGSQTIETLYRLCGASNEELLDAAMDELLIASAIKSEQRVEWSEHMGVRFERCVFYWSLAQ